jgi:hypothetical protein
LALSSSFFASYEQVCCAKNQQRPGEVTLAGLHNVGSCAAFRVSSDVYEGSFDAAQENQ